MQTNKMIMTIKSLTQNEGFIRNAIASFCLPLNPTIDEIIEIKTAVSEAITNVIVHAYPKRVGIIRIEAEIKNQTLYISIKDKGEGIKNIEKALEPFYTTKSQEERTGMGFTVMESFMDKVKVRANKDKGVTVFMEKTIKSEKLKQSLN
ncbi:MAG: anti-sigma F factor [Clostridia bacterium]|nr:anti-sigma F factor [Clostridia bacterium]